jgi:hypothetical protein
MDDTDITALLSRDLTAYQVAQVAFEEARQTLLGTLTAFVGTDPALRARRLAWLQTETLALFGIPIPAALLAQVAQDTPPGTKA